MKEIELKILGITCEHCVRTVKNALYSVEGVSEVDVSLHEQSAKVKAEDHVSFESLKSAVESWGYKVVVLPKDSLKTKATLDRLGIGRESEFSQEIYL
jgi:copper chaperone